MQSNTGRALAAAAGVALIVVLFFVFSGDDETGDDSVPPASSTSAATTTDQAQVEETEDTKTDKPAKEPASDEPETIVIKDGQPVGGVADLDFDKGGEIRFIVDSDTADEVHFHGYDVSEDVEAGGTVEFDVPAEIDGIFEVELEGTATQIAEVTVNP